MYEDLIALPALDSNAPFTVLMSGISYCDGSYKIVRSNCSFYCVEYILKGRGRIRLGQSSFEAKTGDIYILPAGENHYYYSDAEDPWVKVWFNIKGSLIDQLLKTYQIQNLYHIEGLNLSGLFHEFFETAKFNLPHEEIHNRCATVFLQIVQAISHYTHNAFAPSPSLAGQLKAQMDSIVQYDVSFSSLIDSLFCTKSHAIRVFKEAYGITPYQYLLQKKLTVAKMMLKDTRLPMKEIAENLGFQDNHYISSFFKKQTGTSPQQYRKNAMKK